MKLIHIIWAFASLMTVPANAAIITLDVTTYLLNRGTQDNTPKRFKCVVTASTPEEFVLNLRSQIKRDQFADTQGGIGFQLIVRNAVDLAAILGAHNLIGPEQAHLCDRWAMHTFVNDILREEGKREWKSIPTTSTTPREMTCNVEEVSSEPPAPEGGCGCAVM